MPARTLDQVVKDMLGAMAWDIAQLTAQVEKMNADLETPKTVPPTPPAPPVP